MSRALPILLAVAAMPLLATCQQYEFEEVVPKAIAAVNKPLPIVGRRTTPKVMLVVDTSGSMKAVDRDEVAPYCTTNPNANFEGIFAAYDPTWLPAAGQPDCKWNALKRAFLDPDPTKGFLAMAQSKAIFGLTVFPNVDMAAEEPSCGAGRIAVPMGASAGDNIAAIRQSLDAIKPAGGTPTTTTLQVVAGNEAFMLEEQGQDRYVLLLTDGQPNCNPANKPLCKSCKEQNLCFGPTACYPLALEGTTVDCRTYDIQWSTCWDGPTLAAEVRKLKENRVSTFVIGFGSATASGAAKEILNATAVEGGLARTGDIKYYQANNPQDLSEILKEFVEKIQPCNFNLDPLPASANVVQVNLEDTQGKTQSTLVRGADWDFTDGGLGTIEIRNNPASSPWCDMLQTPNRYALQFLYATEM